MYVIPKGKEHSWILLKLMETAAFHTLEQGSVLHGEQQPPFRTGASDLEGQIQTDPCSSAELVGIVRQAEDIYLHKREEVFDFRVGC